MKSIENIRKDFPILNRKVGDKDLVYFDNAATTQTPQQVVDAIVYYYSHLNANIHRGVHCLSQEATETYENARKTLQKHLNAKEAKEIIFTSGTTHGINLVASGFSDLLKEEDEIWVSVTEHHSNIVPWQMLCKRTGAILKIIPTDEKGKIRIDELKAILTHKAALVCCQHVSNALGTIHPIEEIIEIAHRVGAAVLIDGAQASPHIQVDVQKLDVDFYVMSAHKMYGPTGVGMVYGKQKWLEKLSPYQGGGEMIKEVTFERTTYADLPYKFEAGTPNICGGIAFAAAIDYMHSLGIGNIAQYEQKLLEYCTKKLQSLGDIIIYGTDNLQEKTAVISFNIKNVHPYDVGTLLDKMGIAVRTGHHCAQPTMDYFQIPGTVRVSFAVYNTTEEIDVFIEALKKVKRMLM